MVVLYLVLGALFIIGTGMVIAVMIEDGFNWFPFIICIFGLIMSISYITCSISRIKQNTAIEILNGTLQYDTVSLDKNGRLLEIKFK